MERFDLGHGNSSIETPRKNTTDRGSNVVATQLPHGIAIIAGPGTQVAATWAEKSSPIGPKWPRGGKSEGSGQSDLAGQCGLAVKAMQIIGNQPRIKSSQRAKSI